MTRTSMVWKTLLAVITVSAATNCASTGGAPSLTGAPRTEGEGAASDVITISELKRLDPGLSVLDAVEHARPWFLHSRGSVSTVSIDHAPPTEPSILRTMSVADVKEIRLLRAVGTGGGVAIRTNGMIAVGDVVLVLTATGQPR